ncbi:MAG TPA: DUF5320 domain-containing protein [Prolixibacteraceae bacterium]|nr:DUF5320 domain-containing protein [Prolixibacteraceae bacterium]
MARGNKSGPMGQGPMTGRKLGYCAGYDSPGYTKGFGGGGGRGFGFGSGFGSGTGRGRGMGFGRRFASDSSYGRSYTGTAYPNLSRDEEINNLKAQAESLKITQHEIEKRLNELEKRND